MACLQVKLCVAISERFGNAIGLVFKGALQMSRFTLLHFYFTSLNVLYTNNSVCGGPIVRPMPHKV